MWHVSKPKHIINSTQGTSLTVRFFEDQTKTKLHIYISTASSLSSLFSAVRITNLKTALISCFRASRWPPFETGALDFWSCSVSVCVYLITACQEREKQINIKWFPHAYQEREKQINIKWFPHRLLGKGETQTNIKWFPHVYQEREKQINIKWFPHHLSRKGETDQH